MEELNTKYKEMAEEILHFIGIHSLVDVGESLPSSCLLNKQKKYDYRHDPTIQMRNDTRELLQTFFAPFNQKLADLLDDDRFLWKT